MPCADPILERLAAEPDCLPLIGPVPRVERNFFLTAGARGMSIQYVPKLSLVAYGLSDNRYVEFCGSITTPDSAELLAALETALAWLHDREPGRAPETWRDRPDFGFR